MDWTAVIIALFGVAAGGGGSWAAWRLIRPNSTKLVLEGRSTFIAAESGYFDRLTERLERENLRLSKEIAEVRARLDTVEKVEEELGEAREAIAGLTSERDEASARAARAEQRAAQAAAQVTELETQVRLLQDAVHDLQNVSTGRAREDVETGVQRAEQDAARNNDTAV